MALTLRQLRAFVAVAEAGHFTRAADSLSLSQSSVSNLVRELEGSLGLRLLDRHTRMLSLTHAGVEILRLARKTLSDLDGIIVSASQLKTLDRGSITLAAASMQAALVIPRIIHEFSILNPGVKIVLYDVAQEKVHDMVRAGEADFGIGTSSNLRHDLTTRILWTEAFVAVLPPNHYLSRLPELRWRDLKDAPIIGPNADNPVRHHLDSILALEGISLLRQYEVALPLTIIGMVHGGLGIGIMTTSINHMAISLGLTIKEITQPIIKREVSLIFHPDHSLSPAAQNFRDLLVEKSHDVKFIEAPAIGLQPYPK
jgi:LysR family transcriptional regulator, carnitine catabolism transcriptional activator